MLPLPSGAATRKPKLTAPQRRSLPQTHPSAAVPIPTSLSTSAITTPAHHSPSPPPSPHPPPPPHPPFPSSPPPPPHPPVHLVVRVLGVPHGVVGHAEGGHVHEHHGGAAGQRQDAAHQALRVHNHAVAPDPIIEPVAGGEQKTGKISACRALIAVLFRTAKWRLAWQVVPRATGHSRLR